MDSLIFIFFIFDKKNAQYQKMNSLRMLQVEVELDPNFFRKPNISDCLILQNFKPTSWGFLILKILQKLEPDVNKIKNCSTPVWTQPLQGSRTQYTPTAYFQYFTSILYFFTFFGEHYSNLVVDCARYHTNVGTKLVRGNLASFEFHKRKLNTPFDCGHQSWFFMKVKINIHVMALNIGC